MSQLLHPARTILSTKIIDILISSESTHFFNRIFPYHYTNNIPMRKHTLLDAKQNIFSETFGPLLCP